MLQRGSKVRVIGLPHDNDRNWNIPPLFIGSLASVVNVTSRYIIIQMNEEMRFGDGHWNFPLNYDGVLELVVTNRWNPKNYIPRTKPLKLP